MTVTRVRDERGFTLIEIAFAIGIFGAVIIGLSFIFQGAFRTVNRVRYGDVARTVAQEKLEEIRSLPFFVPQNENASDVDVLDRYFPRASGAQYNGAAGVWTYTTTEAIPRDDMPDLQRSVAVQFVSSTGLVPRPPRPGYDSDVAGADEPATDAVKVTVGVTWTQSGTPQSVRLETIIARTAQEAPKVEASGSALGAQVAGLVFQDGDDPGVPSSVVASIANGRIAFREVTGSTAQAAADPVHFTETDPETNLPMKPEGPTDGEAATTVPNSTTGSLQATSANLAAGFFNSVNEPISVIGAWGQSTSAAESRVSALHSQNPESRAQAATADVLVNARDEGAEQPHAVLQMGTVVSVVEQRSSSTQTSVTSSVDIQPSGAVPGVTIWGAPQFLGDARFAGVVTIQSLHVDVTSSAGTTASDTIVNWRVDGLRVWDPDQQRDDGSTGGYVGPWSFGMRADCGAWVDDPNLCGPGFENPNPVLIPPAYAAEEGTLSLSIVAGVTVQDSAADAAAGTASATAGQKNILAITLRDDLEDAVPLERALIGLGDVNTSVSYVSHEH